MAQGGQRKCLCCGRFFFPDHRNLGRQRYCSAVDCRRASKAGSPAAWLAQPGNADYFKSPLHVQRVRQWRSQHPGCSHGRQRPAVALQDPCHARKSLILLIKRPFVPSPPHLSPPWRYKIPCCPPRPC